MLIQETCQFNLQVEIYQVTPEPFQLNLQMNTRQVPLAPIQLNCQVQRLSMIRVIIKVTQPVARKQEPNPRSDPGATKQGRQG